MTGIERKPYEILFLSAINERRSDFDLPPLDFDQIHKETWIELEKWVHEAKPIMQRVGSNATHIEAFYTEQPPCTTCGSILLSTGRCPNGHDSGDGGA